MFGWSKNEKLAKAITEGDKKSVSELLASGADANVAAKTGAMLPLSLAFGGNQLDIARILIERGANVDAKNSKGVCVIHQAIVLGRPEWVEFLLMNGADVNVLTDQQPSGSTPLHLADNLKVVELLLHHGADVSFQSPDGTAPLHDAVSGGHQEIVIALLRSGANVNVVEHRGLTPLHFAAANEREHVGIVKALMSHNADPNAIDKSGNTPRFYAEQNGYTQVLKNMNS